MKTVFATADQEARHLHQDSMHVIHKDSAGKFGRWFLRVLTGSAALVASVFLPGALAQVPLDPELARLPVVERIMQAPVFENPLVYIGELPPDPNESQDLWSAIDVLRQYGPSTGIPALELFIQSYSNSVWTPSLRNDLGFYYRNKGRYSLALEHWEAAWETTRLADSGSAKAVADFALAHYTRLLASLGRVETLQDIFTETRERALDGGPLQQVFNGTREAFRTMAYHPEIAYRCGSLALNNVAKVLQPGNLNLAAISRVGSPATGFSLRALKEMV